MSERADGMLLREALAAHSHESWSRWMRHMFRLGQTRQINIDGGTAMYWLMPAEMFHRWQRQMKTPYADLPESEKESDRLEADRIIEVWDRTPKEAQAVKETRAMRACNNARCGWIGEQNDTVALGGIAPLAFLCPWCGETTEEINEASA